MHALRQHLFTALVTALLAAAALILSAAPAAAQEANLRKVLSERYPQLKLQDISRSPIPGLWEVRYDDLDILYSDEKGDFIIVNGSIVDTRTKADLTKQRIERLLAIDWDQLPLKDAMSIRQGKGTRRLAVFADPNCAFCHRFEREIAALDDVTIYTFLVPMISPTSLPMSRDVWCSKNPMQAWRALMLEGKAPPRAAATCDSKALERNLEFARVHRITATPSTIFADGTRRQGAVSVLEVEKTLAAAARKP